MFSRSSEYALRALSLIALQDDPQPMQSREIAAELGLPPQFLSKILRKLAGAGIVASRRGRTGGFSLARPAEDISLLSVVSTFEKHLSGLECIFGLESCTDSESCPLHDEWEGIKSRLCSLLEKTSLADVAHRGVHLSGEPTGE